MAPAVGSDPTLYTLTACRPYHLTILEYWRKNEESNPDVLPPRQLSRLLATIRRLFHMVRVGGIEPPSDAPKAPVVPLYYTHIGGYMGNRTP